MPNRDDLAVGEGAPGPGYLNHDFGAGFASGLPQVSSQAASSSCGTTWPASASASPSAIARSSASRSGSSNRDGSSFGMVQPYHEQRASALNAQPSKPAGFALSASSSPFSSVTALRFS